LRTLTEAVWTPVASPVSTQARLAGKLVSVVTDEIAGRNLPAWAAEDHACGSCSLAYAQITADDAVQAVQALPAQLRAAVDAVPPGFRRQRPDPSTWSVAEYACHVRDVLVTTTIRLHRGRTEDAPAVDPMFNDLRADLFGYNQANLTAVLEETAAAAAGLCAEIGRVNGPDWDRPVLRRPGEQRTSRWLVRQAMHEGLHHLGDIAAVHASLTRRQQDLPDHSRSRRALAR
jgi:DinB superfamily